jgi:hypothetical protein
MKEKRFSKAEMARRMHTSALPWIACSIPRTTPSL